MDLNAPLYARESESGNASYLNIDWAVNYWLDKGLPREKLVLGLSTYGRAFTLADASQTTPGSANNGSAQPGPVAGFGFQTSSMSSIGKSLVFCFLL